MSSPPWRDVIVKSYCHSNINDSRAMKLSRCMPGLGQGFAMGLDLYLTARFARDAEIAEEVIFPFLLRGQKREDSDASH